ncbi:hypothetical protein SAMN05421734_10392 [Pelagirhabdus alkalitolerans]|uniref:DUF1294 domain-containing protein n=1 Tax=Pelagirhabdus alkalitolerans TaxID=1612202 RepID=A0A1G6HKW2_9BACI|nr:DUF1294 domain-containing protein [Pelagirhabdus alkalitolerans]SDB94889.1 hypothetical protein SAMN05421734_10392 [Pelagirhabdus alkalitolerans]
MSLQLVTYLIVVNVIGLWIMKTDKKRAAKRQWRLSEKSIWSISLVGGAFGVFCGMKLFRHKTKHATFRFGIPALIILQLVLLTKMGGFL